MPSGQCCVSCCLDYNIDGPPARAREKGDDGGGGGGGREEGRGKTEMDTYAQRQGGDGKHGV